MCFPAFSPEIICSACKYVGVNNSTASTFLFERMSSYSVNISGLIPHSLAFDVALSGIGSQSAIISHLL